MNRKTYPNAVHGKPGAEELNKFANTVVAMKNTQFFSRSDCVNLRKDPAPPLLLVILSMKRCDWLVSHMPAIPYPVLDVRYSTF